MLRESARLREAGYDNASIVYENMCPTPRMNCLFAPEGLLLHTNWDVDYDAWRVSERLWINSDGWAGNLALMHAFDAAAFFLYRQWLLMACGAMRLGLTFPLCFPYNYMSISLSLVLIADSFGQLCSQSLESSRSKQHHEFLSQPLFKRWIKPAMHLPKCFLPLSHHLSAPPTDPHCVQFDGKEPCDFFTGLNSVAVANVVTISPSPPATAWTSGPVSGTESDDLSHLSIPALAGKAANGTLADGSVTQPSSERRNRVDVTLRLHKKVWAQLDALGGLTL